MHAQPRFRPRRKTCLISLLNIVKPPKPGPQLRLVKFWPRKIHPRNNTVLDAIDVQTSKWNQNVKIPDVNRGRSPSLTMLELVLK